MHLLFALRQAIDMLYEEKLDNVFLRHRLLAEAVRRAVAVWAEGQVLGFNVAEPNERSNTVTTVVMSNGHDPVALQRYCKEKCGVVIGTGIGDLAGQAFRIAHMGHVNAPMILGTLGVIEVGLKALGIPHGNGGTEAAIAWLGRERGGVISAHPSPCPSAPSGSGWMRMKVRGMALSGHVAIFSAYIDPAINKPPTTARYREELDWRPWICAA